MQNARTANNRVLIAVGVERFLVADSDLVRHQGLARILRTDNEALS